MGIEVLPPCVLNSEKKFSVQNGKIRYGLMGIKNVGGTVDFILEARESGATIDSMLSFLKALDLEKVSKKTVESLINAGAFDCFDPNRAKHLAVYEMMIDRIKEEKKKTVAEQTALWDLNPDVMEAANIDIQLPDVEDLPKHQRLSQEKERLGIYLSGHPLDDNKWIIERLAAGEKTFITTEEFTNPEEDTDIRDNMSVCIVGIIDHIRTLVTKKGDMMAFVGVEDLYGSTEVVVFSECYAKSKDCIAEDAVVVVRGKLNFKEDEAPKIIASKITPISIAEEYYSSKAERASGE
jgi:DNA polymerase-3 subunit alpha